MKYNSVSLMNIENETELINYLVRCSYIAAGEQPVVRVLAGGVSNRTVWVQRANGDAWVVKQALPKLRVEADWFSDPSRIHHEALGIRWLKRLTPTGTVPDLIFEDETHHIMAMRAVPQPHTNWKDMLLRGELQADHVEQFARILADIHHQSAAQRSVIEPVFQDRAFFESLRIEPYYSYTAEQHPQSVAFYQQLIVDTRANIHALVHGDYSPKNILVHNGQLVLLDHEVIHFGDPAFDIGFSMTHLLSKAHHVARAREAFVTSAETYWQVYAATAALSAGMEPRAVRHTLGCLLARVDGRSPMPYLTEAERDRQRRAALQLMARPPESMPDLIATFIQEI
jgi:5-methylthioribose kinase